MKRKQRRRMEGLGLAAAITGLALLSAAFVVGLAAPEHGRETSVAWLGTGD